MNSLERVKKILSLLKKVYPDARCALHHSNPLELLVATILSAQCTDERVNRVTVALFKKHTSAQAYAKADLQKLEQELRPTGFYKQKAKTLKALGQALANRFLGEIPKTMEELVTLPGVWRKTANVILGTAFGTPGIVVDTHVRRLSLRIGLSKETDPDKIEADLMKLIPQSDWTKISHCLIFHGRQICKAARPACTRCPLNPLCPKIGVV
jgi:endonuclease-3